MVGYLLLLWAVQRSCRMKNSFLCIVKELWYVLQVFCWTLKRKVLNFILWNQLCQPKPSFKVTVRVLEENEKINFPLWTCQHQCPKELRSLLASSLLYLVYKSSQRTEIYCISHCFPSHSEYQVSENSPTINFQIERWGIPPHRFLFLYIGS